MDREILGDLLHAAFEKTVSPQLAAKLSQISGMALIFLRRAARHHLQSAHLREFGENFITHPGGKISIALVFAQTLEREHSDGFLRNIRRDRILRGGSVLPLGKQQESRSRDSDQAGGQGEPVRRFPPIKKRGAAFLQSRGERPHAGTRRWLDCEHRDDH